MAAGKEKIVDRFLPGVPGRQVAAAFGAAPGNEIESGKFDSPESSAALAANTLGFFLNRVQDLPPLPGCEGEVWPARSLALEATIRFPWRGGRHPVLDSLVATPSALIGIESKRYEPFRSKGKASLSAAYWRSCWGDRMGGYESVRDALRADSRSYLQLDAAQLFKHAFALRTDVHRDGPRKDLRPVLFYLYAEPDAWPVDGREVDRGAKARHREEIEVFAVAVAGDEVAFVACSYKELLGSWVSRGDPAVRTHAQAVLERYSP